MLTLQVLHLRDGTVPLLILKCALHSGPRTISSRFHPPFCVPQVQLVNDVSSHSWSGGGCECHHGHTGELFPQLAQPLVIGAKVVAPLADAVCLVDHKSGQSVT